MKLHSRLMIATILASFCLLAVSTTAPAQVTSGKEHSQADDAPSRDYAAALQKKANEVQARIRASEGDRDLLKKAVKTTDVPLAKEILVRNGFTAKDLENAKISLRTGGGKGGEDTIEISVTCCDPKEIIIQRTLENFTKTNP
jgi:TolA-binding protein